MVLAAGTDPEAWLLGCLQLTEAALLCCAAAAADWCEGGYSGLGHGHPGCRGELCLLLSVTGVIYSVGGSSCSALHKPLRHAMELVRLNGDMRPPVHAVLWHQHAYAACLHTRPVL
jgi:hypothetical protein